MLALRLLAAGLVTLQLSSCMITTGEGHTVQFDVAAATQYNFRGMPQNENGVLQPSMAVGLPTKDGGTLAVKAWGNMDLTDDTGDAWFPDDNKGRFSQIDFDVDYAKRFGELNVTTGIKNYNVLNGAEFATSPAGSPRGPTSEAFLTVSHEFESVATPFFELHYDFDEIEDFYFRGGAARDWRLGEKSRLDVSAWLGWSGEDMSSWNYGTAQSGFADLAGSASYSYAYDEHTTLRFSIFASSIVDDQIQSWMEDTLGIDSDNVWAEIGVNWAF